MIRDLVQQSVAAAIARLQHSGALPADLDMPVEIVDPRDAAHGDFACSWALAAAKAAGKSPRELAELLKGELLDGDRSNPTDPTDLSDRSDPSATPIPLFSSIEVAGPGFLNLRLADEAWRTGVTWANSRADSLSRPQRPSAPAPQRLNVEFVSVNPNGPITVGSGRGAAFGSTLCNVLEAMGHEVHREYYINDGTNSEQMRLFAESVRAHAVGRPIPPNGYKGEYVEHVARRLLDRASEDFDSVIAQFEYRLSHLNDLLKQAYLLSEQERIAFHTNQLLSVYEGMRYAKAKGLSPVEVLDSLGPELQVLASEGTFNEQADDLNSFGVFFDTWFSEQFLHESGKVAEAIERLKSSGGADENPVRRKLKLAKGGVIEDVEIEEQPGDDEDGIEVSDSTIANPTLWLRSTKFGDDMDRVLRRKDGRLTYISSDVAYHKDKFERGSKPNAEGKCERADKLITILGPDHHGYIGRLHAVLAATELADQTDQTDRSNSSDSPPLAANRQPLTEVEAKIYASPEERDACLAALQKARNELEVLIFQIVRFVKEGKPAPMRKRDGNIYSLRDLMTEIGKDAAPDKSPEEQMVVGKDVARFFYLMRSHDTHMDFDIDLATKGTDENPVFYVQYAHARICSILEKASVAGTPTPGESDPGAQRPTPIALHPKEVLLIKKILDLPEEVARCAEDYGVHRLTTYAIELARTFHHFYDACRVIQPEHPELQAQRLAICEATRHALRGALKLLGISAPEKM